MTYYLCGFSGCPSLVGQLGHIETLGDALLVEIVEVHVDQVLPRALLKLDLEIYPPRPDESLPKN